MRKSDGPSLGNQVLPATKGRHRPKLYYPLDIPTPDHTSDPSVKNYSCPSPLFRIRQQEAHRPATGVNIHSRTVRVFVVHAESDLDQSCAASCRKGVGGQPRKRVGRVLRTYEVHVPRVEGWGGGRGGGGEESRREEYEVQRDRVPLCPSAGSHLPHPQYALL